MVREKADVRFTVFIVMCTAVTVKNNQWCSFKIARFTAVDIFGLKRASCQIGTETRVKSGVGVGATILQTSDFTSTMIILNTDERLLTLIVTSHIKDRISVYNIFMMILILILFV